MRQDICRRCKYNGLTRWSVIPAVHVRRRVTTLHSWRYSNKEGIDCSAIMTISIKRENRIIFTFLIVSRVTSFEISRYAPTGFSVGFPWNSYSRSITHVRSLQALTVSHSPSDSLVEVPRTPYSISLCKPTRGCGCLHAEKLYHAICPTTTSIGLIFLCVKTTFVLGYSITRGNVSATGYNSEGRLLRTPIPSVTRKYNYRTFYPL